MIKEDTLERFFSQDEDKSILLEKMVFAQFADDYDFDNYFRIEELDENEFFRLVSFLYDQSCFLMMFDIMDRYRERFISHDESIIGEVNFTYRYVSRLERLKYLAESRKQKVGSRRR